MNSYMDRIEQKIRETVDPNFQITKMQVDAYELQEQGAALFPAFKKKTSGLIDPNKQVKFEFIFDPVIDASVNMRDREQIHVYLSWGMMNFVHKMIKLFLSRMAVHNDERVIEESQISDEEMQSIAHDLMLGFWKNELWKIPSFELTRLHKGQIELASFLLHYSECFIIAHELGHIILHFCPTEVRKELYIATNANARQVNRLLKSLNIDTAAKKHALEAWPVEFASDLLGLELCLQERDDPVGRSVIRASAELVLIATQMLERYYQKITATDYLHAMYQADHEVSHPPSGLRWEFLHAYVDPLCPKGDISGLGLAFKQFSDALLDEYTGRTIDPNSFTQWRGFQNFSR